MLTNTAALVAVDWGTTCFRLWVLDQGGAVIANLRGAEGMSVLSPDQFAPVLEAKLDQLGVPDGVPAVICGMAGAAQGWVEAAYLPVPCAVTDLGAHAVPAPGAQRPAHILPGLSQRAPDDVMRGEETQLLGLVQSSGGFDGTVCMPGTHTKWVTLKGGVVAGFSTAMTGEMFALLTRQSVLRHATGGGGWDTAAFSDAVADALEAPVSVPEALFSIRASSLLGALDAPRARARLSGFLIGAEIAAMRRYCLSGPVTLIGDDALAGLYRAALDIAGFDAVLTDADALTLTGLRTANAQIPEYA
ncbi:2-dehydro-3-deoxygalactonokinase [Shimia biformata]|uniref:2-dehydro-3-deoxygalactonokinase n=1 Tax=Shimia biformata TaxID=1294299 RepID=UPI0019528E3E|nr:2-dehydro-3-deoxygalactonokinase [Shimia biformata]